MYPEQSDPLRSSETTGKPVSNIFEIYGAFKPLLSGFKRLNFFNSPAACQALLRDCISHKDNILAWFDSESPTLGPEPTPYQNYKSPVQIYLRVTTCSDPLINFLLSKVGEYTSHTGQLYTSFTE